MTTPLRPAPADLDRTARDVAAIVALATELRRRRAAKDAPGHLDMVP